MTRLLVVSDSSSLILAAKAGILGVLCGEFDVQIPRKVFEETVVAGKRLQKADAFRIEQAVEGKRISVKNMGLFPKGKKRDLVRALSLDAGEEEAIALCIQAGADLLLADDRQAINAAKVLEIMWVTVPGIIVEFSRRKKMSRKEALEALKIVQVEGRYRLDFMLNAFNEIEKTGGEGK